MIHTDDQLITWLRYHCSRDRVLQNALSLPRSVKVCETTLPGQWAIDVVSRRGVKYRVVVVMHPVTGEPERYYRGIVPNED